MNHKLLLNSAFATLLIVALAFGGSATVLQAREGGNGGDCPARACAPGETGQAIGECTVIFPHEVCIGDCQVLKSDTGGQCYTNCNWQ